MDTAFKMFDKNKDGFITKEEFAQVGMSTSERVLILNVFFTDSLIVILRFGAHPPCMMRALTINFGLKPHMYI